MSDVFISYSNADRPRVKPLVDALEQRGWSVWWDRTILPGKTWDRVLEEALANTRCVIVLWSRDSIQSEWVRTEADEAKRRGILVPALLDDVIIPLAFRRIQAASLVDWSGVLPSAEFDELARAVSEILSNAAPPPLGTATRTASPASTLKPAALEGHSKERGAVFQEPGEIPVSAEASGNAKSERAPPQEPGNRPLAREAETKQDPQPAAVAQNDRPSLSADAPATSALRKRAIVFGVPAVVLIGVASVGTVIYLGARKVPGEESTSLTRPLAGQMRQNAKDGLEYAWIPPGKFTMGCSPGDSECDSGEKPPHEVTITRGFWIGKTEVTAGAYERFGKATGRPGTGASGSPELPVSNVKWQDALDYCKWAGDLRLPTEAEWEYAARAGTAGSRYGDLDAVAWHRENARGAMAVGKKLPNAWGLYDMLGSVWEWVNDRYETTYYQQNVGKDPPGPERGSWRVLRGGAWYDHPRDVRVSIRGGDVPSYEIGVYGFRCAGELR